MAKAREQAPNTELLETAKDLQTWIQETIEQSQSKPFDAAECPFTPVSYKPEFAIDKLPEYIDLFLPHMTRRFLRSTVLLMWQYLKEPNHALTEFNAVTLFIVSTITMFDYAMQLEEDEKKQQTIQLSQNEVMIKLSNKGFKVLHLNEAMKYLSSVIDDSPEITPQEYKEAAAILPAIRQSRIAEEQIKIIHAHTKISTLTATSLASKVAQEVPENKLGAKHKFRIFLTAKEPDITKMPDADLDEMIDQATIWLLNSIGNLPENAEDRYDIFYRSNPYPESCIHKYLHYFKINLTPAESTTTLLTPTVLISALAYIDLYLKNTRDTLNFVNIYSLLFVALVLALKNHTNFDDKIYEKMIAIHFMSACDSAKSIPHTNLDKAIHAFKTLSKKLEEVFYNIVKFKFAIKNPLTDRLAAEHDERSATVTSYARIAADAKHAADVRKTPSSKKTLKAVAAKLQKAFVDELSEFVDFFAERKRILQANGICDEYDEILKRLDECELGGLGSPCLDRDPRRLGIIQLNSILKIGKAATAAAQKKLDTQCKQLQYLPSGKPTPSLLILGSEPITPTPMALGDDDHSATSTSSYALIHATMSAATASSASLAVAATSSTEEKKADAVPSTRMTSKQKRYAPPPISEESDQNTSHSVKRLRKA